MSKRLLLPLFILLIPELAFYLGYLAAGKAPASGTCGVLALGFSSRRDGTPHPVQISRVDAAVEAFKEQGCSVLVLSGGAAHSKYVEADTMAILAAERGVPGAKLVLERGSRNTWENVRLSLPRLERMDRIFLASDSLHALRARRYLCVQRPDLCSKAWAYSRYRPFELYGLKWLETINELYHWLVEKFHGMPHQE